MASTRTDIDFCTCSLAEFKTYRYLGLSTLNLLRQAIEAKVDSAEKVDYLLNEVLHDPRKWQGQENLSSEQKHKKRIDDLSSRAPELAEFLKLDHPRKIVTALLQYQAESKGKNNWYVNLLLAEYYLKLESKEESFEKAIVCISTLFDDNYFTFRSLNAEFIKNLILDIFKFNKDKARELLKVQLMKEVNHHTTRYKDVKHIVRALQAIDGFDENIEKEFLTFLNQESKLFLDHYDNDAMMIALLSLATKVREPNRQQLLDLLFEQFRTELTLANREEISYPLILEELVKADYFNKVSTDKLDDLLNVILDKHVAYTRFYSKNLIAKLEEIKKFVKETKRLYSIERALAKCYLDLIPDQPDKAAIKIAEIPLDQLKILFLVELESKQPRFSVIAGMVNIFLSKKSFAEEQKNALLKYSYHIIHWEYKNLNQNDRNILMKFLIDLLLIETDNNKRNTILSNLANQYLQELQISKDISEISQKIFDLLDGFGGFGGSDCMDFESFSLVINTIALHATTSRIIHLAKIKNHVKDPAYLQLVAQVLLKSCQDLINSSVEGSEIKSTLQIPIDQSEPLFFLELKSERPRFALILFYTANLLYKKWFNEPQQIALIKCYQHILDHNYKSLSYHDRNSLMLSLFEIIPVATPSNRKPFMALLGRQYAHELSIKGSTQRCFAELVRIGCFNEMPIETFKEIINSNTCQPIETHIEQLNQLKKIITDRRIDLVNQALVICYANLPDLASIEKAIAISKEVKLDTPDVLRKLAKKIEPHKTEVAIELLLKCHEQGDIDALLDVASIYEKNEKIPKVIEYYKLCITDAVTTSSLSTLTRGVGQLFALLATQGGGFPAATLTEIKQTILLAYQFVFENSVANDSCKFDFLNLFFQYLMKTKPLNIDLSELFAILHKDNTANIGFLNLACSYFPASSEKYKEYYELRINLLSSRMKLQSLKILSESKGFEIANLLHFVINKFFALAKTDPLFNETQEVLESCVAATVLKGNIDANAFKLLFSSEIENLGDLTEIIQNSFKKTLHVHKNYALLFEMYYYMLQFDKYKNKNDIANCIIEVIAKMPDVRKYKNPFLHLALDRRLHEGLKSELRKYSNLVYPADNADKMLAKEFVRVSHLPAIAFLINRKSWVGNNPGYDYLCVIFLILTKHQKPPELKATIEKAQLRIQNLPRNVRKQYNELIENAPVNLVNVHLHLRLVTKNNDMRDGILQGMRQALGLQDKIVWNEWLQIIDTINAPKIDVKPNAPVLEESKAIAVVPSAPPLDEEAPKLATTSSAMFYHSPGGPTKAALEKFDAASVVTTEPRPSGSVM
ncbi:MAG: hypothetical protein ACYCQI_03135 [Gammaproteobacteria bacterium]